jgi:cytochrome P450
VRNPPIRSQKPCGSLIDWLRIFKIGTRYIKHRDDYNLEVADGFFNILEPKAAKQWRDPYANYFSKAAISRLEPLIHERVNKFFSLLDQAGTTKNLVDLSMGFRSLTSDVVSSYIFGGQGFELLEVKDFQSPILVAVEQFFDFYPWCLYFPKFTAWLTRQLQKLKREQAKVLVPQLAATNWILEV